MRFKKKVRKRVHQSHRGKWVRVLKNNFVGHIWKDGAGLDLAVSDRKAKVIWAYMREFLSFSYKGPRIESLGRDTGLMIILAPSVLSVCQP